MYGYSLEREGTPIELINVRLRAVGVTEKPTYTKEEFAGTDPSSALKGERKVYLPESRTFETVRVFDGHRTRYGNRIDGPAVIEQVNTTLFLSQAFDCTCDPFGSFAVYLKGREDHSQKVTK
jgi:N-methylhydantoinase A